MALDKLAGIASSAAAPAISPKESFAQVAAQLKPPSQAPSGAPRTAQEIGGPEQAHRAERATTPDRAASGVREARAAPAIRSDAKAQAAHWVDAVSAAQARLEHVLSLARSGKTFTPAELLGLQAQVYGASQQLDLAGKIVDKATGGLKQILTTNL